MTGEWRQVSYTWKQGSDLLGPPCWGHLPGVLGKDKPLTRLMEAEVGVYQGEQESQVL